MFRILHVLRYPWKSIRISQTLIVNSLCCAIGPLLAWNLWWVWRYRHVLAQLWQTAKGLLAGPSH